MTKKQRLSQILSQFGKEEREILEALGKKRLLEVLELEHDDEMLIMQLKNLIPTIQAKQAEVKAKVKAEKSERAKVKRERERVEIVEPIELYVPKLGRIEIDKNVFSLFCDLFNFSISMGKKKVTSLFIYYPKRMPLISINIDLNCIDAEYLLIDTIEDYIMLEDTNKNWSTFVGIFSKNVYSLLDAIGNKTIRRKRITIKENPCYVYNSNGELVKVIKEDNKKVKEEYTHEMPIMVSWEMLKEKELA